MSVLELAAIIAGYALAAMRVMNAARWSWAFLPPVAQVLLPAIVTALPALASALGGVETKLDIVEAIVVFLGALGTAWRGSLPGGGGGGPGGGNVAAATGALAFLMLVGCAPAVDQPPCDAATAQRMAAACAMRTEIECVQAGLTEENCHVISECAEQAKKREQECLR